MKVLAVDTALTACSVAVVSDEVVLAYRSEPMERGHAEALAPMVENAIADAGIEFSALDRLGVTTGPGTFTGLRVGLAFMRGLRLALKVPLVGMTSLFVMALEAMAETKLAQAAAIHDARHDDVYFELLHGTESEGPLLLPVREAASRVAEHARGLPVALAGAAQSRIQVLVGESRHLVGSEVVVPDARWIARIAATATAIGGVPKPLYLRAPAAKVVAARK